MTRSKLLMRTALGIYWGIAFALTHFHLSPVIAPKPGMDKVYHFVGYFILGTLLMAFLKLENRMAQSRLRSCLLIVVLYSLFDEGTQPIVGRDFELLDLVADWLGATSGAWVCQKIFPWTSIGQ